jgi:hypothetical protein
MPKGIGYGKKAEKMFGKKAVAKMKNKNNKKKMMKGKK